MLQKATKHDFVAFLCAKKLSINLVFATKKFILYTVYFTCKKSCNVIQYTMYNYITNKSKGVSMENNKTMISETEKKGNWWALLPIAVFLVVYIGFGILFGDFYKMSVVVAFLVAILVACFKMYNSSKGKATLGPNYSFEWS